MVDSTTRPRVLTGTHFMLGNHAVAEGAITDSDQQRVFTLVGFYLGAVFQLQSVIKRDFAVMLYLVHGI